MPDRNNKIFSVSNYRIKTIVFLLILCAITTWIYFPATKHDFIKQWDDPSQISENYDIRNLSCNNIIKIFSNTYVGMYQPIPTITYAIEYKFFNNNPSVYHTTNIFLHLINILLVFWLLLLWTGGNRLAAAIATSLFALHPMNVETVAWLSTRSNLILTMFSLLSLISYLKYIKSGYRKTYYILTLFCFILALFSKSQSIILPLLFILFDYYFHRTGKSKFWEKLPFFLLSIIFGIITLYTRKPEGDYTTFNFQEIFEKILYVCYAIFWYLCKFFVPYNSSPIYYYPEKINNSLPVVYYITPFILAVLVFFIIRYRKKIKDLIYALLFFILSISITLPFFILGSYFVADRYAYLPYVGLFWFTGIKISALIKKYDSLKEKFKKTSLFIFIFCVLICFSYLTYNRNLIWKNSKTLYKEVIYKRPNSYMGWSSLANAYQDDKQYKEAIFLYHKALKLNPYDPDVYLNLSNAYLNTQNYWKALWYIDICIALNDKNAGAYANRAAIEANMYNHKKALIDYIKSIKIDNSLAYAWMGLGSILLELKVYNYAIQCFNFSIALNKDYDETLYLNRGICYLNSSKYLEALKDFNLVLKRNISNYEAYHNIGALLVNTGQYTLAKKYLDKAINLNKNAYESYTALGINHYKRGEYYQALYNLDKSIAINNAFPNAYLNKALVLSALNKKKEALYNFNKAILLDSTDYLNYFYRGLFYYNHNKFNMAVKDFTKAISLSNNIAECYFYRGLAHEKLGNYQNAMIDLSKSIDLTKGKNLSYYFYRGLVYTKMEDFASAIKDFTLVEKDTNFNNNYLFHNNYGVSLMGIEQNKKAIEEFIKALSLKPDFTEAVANLGIARYKNKEYKQAIELLTKAEKQSCTEAKIYYYRAKAFAELKKYDNANMDFTRAINKDPSNAFYYYERAMNKSNAGNHLGAISDFEQAIKIDSLNPVYYLNRGNSYTALMQIENALKDYKKSIEVKKDYADAYFNAGILKFKNGNINEAIQDFSKVIELNPDDHEAYFRRGVAKLEAGDKDGACEDWLSAANKGSIKTNIYVLTYCVTFIDIKQ